MYHNPFTPGYEVLAKSGYNIDSHGSISTTAQYLITNDFPNYAAMFYSPSEHEVFSSIKYGNFAQDYSNLRDIQQSLNGNPMESYVPSSFVANEGSGRQDFPLDIGRAKETLDEAREISEIQKAQEQVSRKILKIEFEDVLLLRKRKRTIIFENRKEDF